MFLIVRANVSVNALREIAFYCKPSHTNWLLVPKSAMTRIIKDVVLAVGAAKKPAVIRVSFGANALIQQLAEVHIVTWFEMLYVPAGRGF
jgi:hypothetical protein